MNMPSPKAKPPSRPWPFGEVNLLVYLACVNGSNWLKTALSMPLRTNGQCQSKFKNITTLNERQLWRQNNLTFHQRIWLYQQIMKRIEEENKHTRRIVTPNSSPTMGPVLAPLGILPNVAMTSPLATHAMMTSPPMAAIPHAVPHVMTTSIQQRPIMHAETLENVSNADVLCVPTHLADTNDEMVIHDLDAPDTSAVGPEIFDDDLSDDSSCKNSITAEDLKEFVGDIFD